LLPRCLSGLMAPFITRTSNVDLEEENNEQFICGEE
jgi:hypothetical protein